MVPEGSRLRARQKLVSVEPKSGGFQVVNEVTIEMEGAPKPACVAELVTLVFK
jgi:acyl dehydratase